MKLFNPIVLVASSFAPASKHQILGIMGRPSREGHVTVITAYDMVRSAYTFDTVNANLPIYINTGTGGDNSPEALAYFEIAVQRGFNGFQVAYAVPPMEELGSSGSVVGTDDLGALNALSPLTQEFVVAGTIKSVLDMHKERGRSIRDTKMITRIFARENEGKLNGHSTDELYDCCLEYLTAEESGQLGSTVSEGSLNQGGAVAQVSAPVEPIKSMSTLMQVEFADVFYGRNNSVFESLGYSKEEFTQVWEIIADCYALQLEETRSLKILNPFMRSITPMEVLVKNRAALRYQKAYEVMMRSMGIADKGDFIINRDELVSPYEIDIKFNDKGVYDPREHGGIRSQVPIGVVPYQDVLKYYLENVGGIETVEVDSSVDGSDVAADAQDSESTSLFADEDAGSAAEGTNTSGVADSSLDDGMVFDTAKLNLRSPRNMDRDITIESLFDSVGHEVVYKDGVPLLQPLNPNFPAISKDCPYWTSYSEIIEREGNQEPEPAVRAKILDAVRGNKRNDTQIGLYPCEQFWYEQWQDVIDNCLLYENDKIAKRDIRILIRSGKKPSMAIKFLFLGLIKQVLILTRMHTGRIFDEVTDAEGDEGTGDDGQLARYCFYAYDLKSRRYSHTACPVELNVDITHNPGAFGAFRDLFDLLRAYMDNHVKDVYGYPEAFAKLCRQGDSKPTCLVMRNGYKALSQNSSSHTQLVLNLERAALGQYAGNMGNLVEYPTKDIYFVGRIPYDFNSVLCGSKVLEMMRRTSIKYQVGFPVIFGVQTQYQNNPNYERIDFIDVLTLTEMLSTVSSSKEGKTAGYQIEGVVYDAESKSFKWDPTKSAEDLAELKTEFSEICQTSINEIRDSAGSVTLDMISERLMLNSSQDIVTGSEMITIEYGFQEPYTDLTRLKEKLATAFPEREGSIKSQTPAALITRFFTKPSLNGAIGPYAQFTRTGKLEVTTARMPDMQENILALQYVPRFLALIDYCSNTGFNPNSDFDLVSFLNLVLKFKSEVQKTSSVVDHTMEHLKKCTAFYKIVGVTKDTEQKVCAGWYGEYQTPDAHKIGVLIENMKSDELTKYKTAIAESIQAQTATLVDLDFSVFMKARFTQLFGMEGASPLVGTAVFVGNNKLNGTVAIFRNLAERLQ